MIEQIANHLERARDRLAEQFRGLPNVDALLAALMIPVQQLEDVFFDLRDSRSLFAATGVQLDLWGQLLNKPRGGVADDTLYRIVLLAKVAQNISQGTPEDVMGVFRLLMQASYVIYYEPPDTPAAFQLTAVGADPIGKVEDIKSAVRLSKLAGVKIDLLTAATQKPFAFFGNPDANARGFGDLNDPAAGGTFSSII